MAHKNKKLLGLSQNFMQTHKKPHKNFLILKINILNKKNILVNEYEYYIKRKTFF